VALSVRWRVPSAVREERQALRQALDQLVGRQDPRPRRCELDGKGKPVQPAADLPDRVLRFRNVRVASEERDRIVFREGSDVVFALTVDPKRCARSAEQTHVWTRAEQLRQSGRAVDDLLEVVEQKQKPFFLDEARKLLFGADARGDRREDEIHVGYGCQRNPEDAVLELVDDLGRRLECQPRLSGSTCACQGHDPPCL
jgi:hypothetical protein